MIQQQLRVSAAPGRAVSPFLELGAYEWLWAQEGASFKRIADMFRDSPDALPSDLVDPAKALEMAAWVVEELERRRVSRFGVRVNKAGEYPPKLRDARNPVELLTYQGIWNLVEAPGIAVVGARKASREGLARARKLVRALAADGFTIVSGLAEGIDTAAHETALAVGAPTIAVLGTPLGETYPKKNAPLQQRIAREHLVISQVPLCRYVKQDYRSNRAFFPERNKTMSALTLGTVIVEASDTSGSLTQARAALAQGRKLFILDSCFKDPRISWPERFAEKGAIRVADYDDLREHLEVSEVDRPN
jgi:DNA processing protein